MDSLLFDQQQSHLNQESISFQPNDTFSVSNHGDQYTTLNDIGDYEYVDNDNDVIELEDGEMDRTKLSIFNPLYKEINPSTKDHFYMDFFSCLEQLNGHEKSRYRHMKNRFKKFFVHKDGIERGERWNQRIEPDYRLSSTHPLCFAIMLYGIDYLSNRDIKKIFNLPKEFKEIKRINWSNAAIMFESKAHLEQTLKPHLFDNEKCPFFEPKEEEDLAEFLPTKLPRGWYGLRPYEHKDEYIFWFVRYLTNQQPQSFGDMAEKIEFMELYNVSRRTFEKKKMEKEEFDSVMSASRFETIDRSQKERSFRMGSEPQRRERSREKSRHGAVSQNLVRSGATSGIESNKQNQNILANHPDLNESYVEPMSFVYAPSNSLQVEAQLKKKSDQIIMMMECLHMGPETNIMENFRRSGLNDLDDDMAVISDVYDPHGKDKCFFFDKRNKIAELTTLKPAEKFNYKEYVEKILEAEEQNKEKKAIPVIYID